ncbi:MAG: TonB-dependent receptor [Nitrospirota bacterium]|nr:TonB-dependent receptor [Nitrospirota bacterium]
MPSPFTKTSRLGPLTIPPLAWTIFVLSLLLNAISAGAQPTTDPQIEGLLDLLQEEQSLQPFELGEIFSATSQPLGPTTATFEVTAQDILDQNARSLADALRFVPGLYLSVGGTTAPSFASIRGLTARQNVVFIDGRPVYDPFFGDLRLENLPVDNIAKIKVIKGPVDPVYGPNTIGTVINIVTKRGTAVPSTRGTISYDAHNTQDYWLEHGGRNNQFNYYLAGSYRRSNGFSLANDFSPTAVQPGEFREQSSLEKGNVSGNFGYDFSAENKVALVVGYYDAKQDNPVNINLRGTARQGLPFTRFTDWKRWYTDLYGQTKIGNRLELRGNAYFDRFQNDLAIFTDDTFSTVDDVSKDTNDVFGINAQGTFSLTDFVKIKGGVFLKQDQHERKSSDGREEIDSFTTGYFLDTEWVPIPNLIVSAGLNYDILYANSDRTVSAVSPRGAVIFQPFTSTRLHAAIGQKSRLPRLINLYSGVSNLSLQEERNLLVEVGASQSFLENRLELGVTWFRNALDDVIGFVRLPGAGRRTQDQNLTDATTMGIESYLSAKLTDSVKLLMDYTYLNVSVDTDNESHFDRFLHQFNANLQYQSNFGLGGFLQVSYIDGEPDAFPFNSTIGTNSLINFVLLNGKITYEIYKGIRPFLAIENLTDSNYARNLGFPESGRRFFVGINAQF